MDFPRARYVDDYGLSRADSYALAGGKEIGGVATGEGEGEDGIVSARWPAAQQVGHMKTSG